MTWQSGMSTTKHPAKHISWIGAFCAVLANDNLMVLSVCLVQDYCCLSVCGMF